MKTELQKEIERIGLEIVAKKTCIADLETKTLTGNFTVGDLYRFKHALNLNNEKVCAMFEI